MLWLLSTWEKARCPSPVNLIELGPGTGVMMMDMLRVRISRDYILLSTKYFILQHVYLVNVFIINMVRQ